MSIFDVLSLIGGLAIFLFGMQVMGNSLEKISDGKLEGILEKMTNSRIKGVLLGMAVTAVIQSSSAVIVMAVGFVNSGIMGLGQVIGIIMGANIGTTVTSWLLSLTGIESTNIFISLLKPSSFAPVLAIIGVIMLMFAKTDKKRNVGNIMVSFAVLMIGMTMMSDSVSGLQNDPAFTGLLTKFSNPLLGVLAGLVLTTIIQSSSASVGILQALSSTGAITVGAAFPIILGQNIGTCTTVFISSIGANKNAKRAAWAHMVFNIIGVVMAMVLFYGVNAFVQLPFINKAVNPATIAIIHSLFNIFATIVIFPFGKQFEKLMCILVKDKKSDKQQESSQPTLIDEKFIITPTYALDKTKEKCDEMAQLAKSNILMCLEFIKIYNRAKDETIKKNEKELDAFEDELETYLVKISTMDLSFNDSLRLSKLSHAISNFERIGDYGVNILKTKRKMHNDKIHFSDVANKELDTMSRAVREIVENSVAAFISDDAEMAKSIEPLEQVIDNLKAELRARHSHRMENGECTVENGMLFFDIVNSFERIADHCSNLAVCIIELSQGSYQTHSYLKGVKNSENKTFMENFEEYLNKYSVK